MKSLVVCLITLLIAQPVLAEVPDSGAGYPVASGRAGVWSSHWHVGLWYNRYDVTKPEGRFSEPGLLSLAGGLDSNYDFNPVFVGFNADLYTPQIVWKSLGLGLFYMVCFIFTGGKCNVDLNFGTGDRDAGLLAAGASAGVNFADFSDVPARVYAGLDYGLFHSGFTPRPFSTLFVKGGVGYDITPDVGLDLSVRRSVWMAQWDFGSDNGVYDPTLWVMMLNVVLRR